MQNVGIVVSFLNAYVLAVRSMSNMNIVLCSDYKCFFSRDNWENVTIYFERDSFS